MSVLSVNNNFLTRANPGGGTIRLHVYGLYFSI
jgi:hypothetical protein